MLDESMTFAMSGTSVLSTLTLSVLNDIFPICHFDSDVNGVQWSSFSFVFKGF